MALALCIVSAVAIVLLLMLGVTAAALSSATRKAAEDSLASAQALAIVERDAQSMRETLAELRKPTTDRAELIRRFQVIAGAFPLAYGAFIDPGQSPPLLVIPVWNIDAEHLPTVMRANAKLIESMTPGDKL